MNNPNNNSETSDVGNVVSWLSDYAWLLAGCLFVLVAVRTSANRTEDEEMRQIRERIEAMARTDRERLRHNQSEFRQLDAQEERRLRNLHKAVCENEKLEKTLDRWNNWLTTLPLEQREKILAAKTPQERIEIVRQLRQGRHGRRGWHGGHTQEPPLWARSKQPTRFRPEDYKAMLRIAAKWCGLPVDPEQPDPRSQLAHHILIVTTLLDETFPGWDQTPEPGASQFGRNRPEIPAELRDRLVGVISDENIRRMLGERVDGRPVQQQGAMQNIMLLTFFARGLFEETRRAVGNAPLSEDDRLAIYLKLPPKAQQELDRLPREAFNFRIQRIAMQQALGPEAGAGLERLSLLFERLNNRRPGQNSGRRGEGNDGRDKDRPPGRPGFGKRPPGRPQPGQ